MTNASFITSLLVAGGIALGGFFPGYYYYKTRFDMRTVTVKGLAEQDVKADLGVWNIRFQSADNGLSVAKNNIEAQEKTIRTFLKDAGFTDNEIIIQGLGMQDAYADSYRDRNSIPARYTLTQTLTVRSDKVDLIAKTYPKIGDLVSNGVNLGGYGNGVSYLFTGINAIKPAMLKKATQNARKAADEFAKNSQSKVGDIRSANQGVFSILPREDIPDQSEREQINKKVRVVSTVEYYLN
ncbi:MAG: SIMPL domain-containing protein [Alphaproteobacteria bacterium]|nr:SIMPL domain-containing protein [Alphaproteobacteria bacterium]